MPELGDRSRPVVVTGATGFLGRALCAHLYASGFQVRAAARIERPGLWTAFVPIDLPDRIPGELFEGVDVVYHLAGRAHALVSSRGDAALYAEVNSRGTAELASRAKRSNVRRFVFMSTVKALGEPGESVVREDQASTARDPYGLSKYAAEQSLMRLNSPSFTVVILRPVVVYGPGAKGNLETLLRFLENGRMPPLPPIDNRRSMVGVNDLIRATVLAAWHPEVGGRAYTITDGKVYSTTRIIETLATALGITRRSPVTIPSAGLRAGAAVGDLAYRLTGRRLPLDSDLLSRLVGNAEYESSALSTATGFEPREGLRDLAASIVAGYAPYGR